MGSGLLKLGPATLPPACCFICSCTPVDESREDRPLHPFIYPEGMDINWGDTPYICWDCAGVIADLIERPSRDKFEALMRGAKLQKKHNERLVKENEELKKAVQGLLDGSESRAAAEELMSDG